MEKEKEEKEGEEKGEEEGWGNRSRLRLVEGRRRKRDKWPLMVSPVAKAHPAALHWKGLIHLLGGAA